MIDFFSPVSENLTAYIETLPMAALGRSFLLYSKKDVFPDLEGVTLALFGVSDYRNSVNSNTEEASFIQLRKALYQLYPGNWSCNMVDLGNIKKGHTIADTYFAVKEVSEELLKKDIIPIILGGSQDLVYAQYKAYNALEKMINMVNVDQCFDLGDADKKINNKSYLSKIIIEEPYRLFNYSVLGYQSYLNPPEEIALMEKLFFDAYRVGKVVSDITTVEPIMRNADLVAIDLTVIKSVDLGHKCSTSSNGLDSREICAIARYAGISNRVSSFGVYEFNNLEQAMLASGLIAQMIWYFIEGVNFRVNDDDFEAEENYKVYKVPVDDEVLIFRNSNKTGRWWIELPFISSVNNKLKKQALLPCTHNEYLSAIQQEIPERWLKACYKNKI